MGNGGGLCRGLAEKASPELSLNTAQWKLLPSAGVCVFARVCVRGRHLFCITNLPPAAAESTWQRNSPEQKGRSKKETNPRAASTVYDHLSIFSSSYEEGWRVEVLFT